MIHQISNFVEWRRAARECLDQRLPPEQVHWVVPDHTPEFVGLSDDITPPGSPIQATVPRAFLELADTVACYRDAGRWALLYRVLWRLTHGEPHLLKIEVDPDTRRLHLMERAVRRDIHKMHAFVRFRSMQPPGGAEEVYVAWHRPDHLIVEKATPFFARRFGAMRWSIFTPDAAAHWDLKTLSFSPGVQQAQVSTDNGLEDLWRAYYSAIFNPARLNLKAMKTEMPVRHWQTLPEATIIPDLVRVASLRETSMRNNQAPSAAAFVPAQASLPQLASAAQACRGCSLYKEASQAVMGEGLAQAAIVLVGEAPGDQEDRKVTPS